MNEFRMIKDFLDKHPDMMFKFIVEQEGVDQDTTDYIISLHLKPPTDDVTSVQVRGAIFDELETNIGALISAATAAFGLTE